LRFVVDLSERMVRRENGDEREWKMDGGDGEEC